MITITAPFCNLLFDLASGIRPAMAGLHALSHPIALLPTSPSRQVSYVIHVPRQAMAKHSRLGRFWRMLYFLRKPQWV